MRTGSAWSRSEWLRRLGFKTGDEPPIAVAIQPTLGSGDASELLPPLLAPQGWYGDTQVTPPALSFAALEIIAGAKGGAYLDYLSAVTSPSGEAFVLQNLATRPAAFTFGSLLTGFEEQEGVRTIVNGGSMSSLPNGPAVASPVSAAGIGNIISVFIKPGTRLYITCAAATVAATIAVHVRDIPVGLAPD